MIKGQTAAPGVDNPLPAGQPLDSGSIAAVIAIIVIAGLIGGLAAYVSAPQESEIKENARNSVYRYLLLGLVASACAPLFLTLVQSDLVNRLFQGLGRRPFAEYLVFLGICLIAAFSARGFLESVSRRVLRDIENVKEEQRNLEQQVQTTGELVDENAHARPVDSVERLAAATAVVESVSLPQVGELERNALRALSTLSFRTVAGLAEDLGEARAKTKEVLESLRQKGLTTIEVGPAGARWKITDKGIALASQSAG